MGFASASFTSPYFHLEPVADGVYAAIIIGGTGAWGNAGIVDLGDHTLVFDTFFTPTAAASLREAAEQVTGHSVTYVINSHRHADHVFGNQVFPDALIIATEQTRRLMETHIPVFLEQVRAGSEAPHHLAERLSHEQDLHRRKDQEWYLADIQALSSVLDQLEPRLPNVTFERRLVLRGSKRTAEVLTFGGGHTSSDVLLYLPQEAIGFLGDLVQVGFHPTMGESNPEEWIRILAQVETLNLSIVVPGHGPVGTRADVVTMRHYFTDLRQLASRGVEERTANGQSTSVPIPPAYVSWECPSVFPDNLHFLYEQQTHQS